MEIRRITVGLYQTNCYLLVNDGEIVIIDPGSSWRKIEKAIEQYDQAKVIAIILTHGHFDHIGAVDDLVRVYRCPVYGCQDDEKMMRNEKYNSLDGLSATVSCDVNWLTEKQLKVGSFEFEIIYSPGHTNGSIMLLIDDCLFSGDTLFYLSVGRTDLYSGSSYKLSQSLQQLKTLDPKTVVYPGHGELTTVGFELRNNPYII